MSSSLPFRGSSTKAALPLLDAKRSPTVSEDGPIAGDTATIITWRKARDTYRKSLPEKDLKCIFVPAGPEDVINEVERWQQRQKKSKYCRVASVVSAGIPRLQRFNHAIDMLAQGSPAPGSLLWGSIVFVLTVVQNAAEEYEKLCNALSRMMECLPRIELYTETFLDSGLVQNCVNAYYGSMLRFWTRACKFYRRHRLWNVLRVVWHDYDAEFGDLELEMIRCRDAVESAAFADHIRESKTARLQQRSVNRTLLDAHSSATQREIIAWLAPMAYNVDYYGDDLASAGKLRHPKTCLWFLEKDEYTRLRDGSGAAHLLWICAQPGAGKTVLSSFLVDHFTENNESRRGNVLFFFCKSADADKNTPIAIVRSLLYQLYQALRDQGCDSSLNEDIGFAMESSGQKRALNLTTVWDIFSSYIRRMPSVTLVIDALDECHDPEILIASLQTLAVSQNVKVIVTSRKEAHLYKALGSNESLEIMQKDVNADIRAFVEAKVAASPRLSHPSVRDMIIKRLCNDHGGMFLWVHLMLKELKSCFSTSQVHEELNRLPTGLDGIYNNILKRLQETLDKNSLDLCSKVLTWVVTAMRPLNIDEIKHALVLHYESEGHSLLSSDGCFPYSNKDIELVCGSLVSVENNTIRVIHLTIKQYLTANPNDVKSALHVELGSASSKLTAVCWSCIQVECTESMARLDENNLQTYPKRGSNNSSLVRTKVPFLEYASSSWILHLMDCDNTDLHELSKLFRCTFESHVTFSWIELCMTFGSYAVLHLVVGLNEVQGWVKDVEEDHWPSQDPSCRFFESWCSAMHQLFKDYGSFLSKRPSDIRFLDLEAVFSDHDLAELYEKHGKTSVRESSLQYIHYRNPRLLLKTIPPHRQLRPESRYNSVSYDPTRDVFLWNDLEASQQVLFAQSAATGRRLRPAIDPEKSPDIYAIYTTATSKNGKYLGLVQFLKKNEGQLLTIWEIDEKLDFRKPMHGKPWARTIFKRRFDPHPVKWESQSIAFRDDGYCCTPFGFIHLSSGTVQPFAGKLLDQRCDQGVFDKPRASYSGNGGFLFLWQERSIKKISCPALTLVAEFTSENFSIAQPDRTGRYLLSDCMASLLDTVSQREVCLLSRWRGFLFDRKIVYSSLDENEILCFAVNYHNGRCVLIVSHYVGLLDQIHLKSQQQTNIEAGLWRYDIWVDVDIKKAVMVSPSGEVQRISIGENVEFLDSTEDRGGYTGQAVFISQDCSHWASIHCGSRKMVVQVFVTNSPDAEPRRQELEPPSGLGDLGDTRICMNSDLSVLVVNQRIYKLANVDGQIPSKAIISMDLTGPALGHDGCDLENLISQCRVSSDCMYVGYIHDGSECKRMGHEVLQLYRLDLEARSATRMPIPLPPDMKNVSMAFHPSLPLMVVGYGLATQVGVSGHNSNISDRDYYEGPVNFHVALYDLRTASVKYLEFPDDRTKLDVEAYHRTWCPPSFLFSGCGTFVFCLHLTRIQFTLDFVEPRPIRPRYIPFTVRKKWQGDKGYETIEDRIGRYLTINDPCEYCYEAERTTRPIMFSSTVCIGLGALLLGETDDYNMRLLTVPTTDRFPKIKELSLTFRQVQETLDERWVQSNR